MSTSGGSGSTDPTLLELFAAEVDMHLPVLSEGLLALEKGSAGKKEIESMMRAAHSIKGAARIVGNDRAVRVSHIMEDCFIAAKEDRITLTSDAVDILLEGVDMLQRICSPATAAEMSEAILQPVLERIATVREGKRSSSAASDATASALAAHTQPAQITVVFPATFDASAADSLRVQLCDILAGRPSRIRIDFAQVDHLSVAGLSLLLTFVRETAGMQPAPAVEADRVAPPVRALFRVVGLDRAFSLKD